MNGRTNSTPVETENLEIPLEPPTNLTADPGNGLVTLKWTDPENKYAVVIGDTAEETDQLVSEFDHSVVIRKNNSDPIDPSDGTVITTATKNQYQSTGYIDSNLPNDIEYHYGVYAINKAGIPSSGIYAHATPMSYRAASTFPVGSIFKMNISGEPWEFIVVQQGLPTTGYSYNASCNGTWLLMKNTFIEKQFSSDEYDNSFNQSDLKNYLNTEFYNSFDTPYKVKIKHVSVPYQTWGSMSMDYGTGISNGYVFIPSMAELGFEIYIDGGYDGSALDYFKNEPGDGASSLRASGNKKRYWTRTADSGRNPPHIAVVDGNGSWYSGVSSGCDDIQPVRPAMIIDSNAMFNDNGELLIT